MEALRDPLRTLARGVLFLVPFALLIILAVQAVKLIRAMLEPLAKLMPAETVVGIAADYLLAVVALIALCLLAGILARTVIIGSLGDRLEQLLVRRIPGFTIVKAMTEGVVGLESKSAMKVALAWVEECWVLAFVMERNPGGLSTVFIPSAPTPAAGSIYYLPDDRLRLLDVPVSTAIGCITRLGVGSQELLASASLEAPATAATGS